MDLGGALAALNPVAMLANAGTSIGNFLMQGKTNQQNEDMVNNQMNFQREMSNTAHQREVEDLIKAGLNPILSATKGASSPSGASTTLQAPQINMPDFMSYGVSLQGLQNAKRALDQGDQKLKIEMLNALTNTEYTKTKTKNEKYGINGIISDFMKEMKNEDRSHESINSLGRRLQKLIDNYEKNVTQPKQPTHMQDNLSDGSMLGLP